MKRLSLLAVLLCLAPALPLAAEELKLSAIETLPEGIPAEMAKLLQPTGHSVASEDGVVCNVWLLKELPVKAGFKPNLYVKYPFGSGQLVGVIQIVQTNEYTDFRGQEVKPGVYTLRYGLQPQDGNHVGTSEVRDFLLATPIADDKSPAVLADETALFNASAKSAGTTHPAIFSLQGAGEPGEKATLKHHGELWSLNVTATISEEGKAVKLPIQVVVVGVSEG